MDLDAAITLLKYSKVLAPLIIYQAYFTSSCHEATGDSEASSAILKEELPIVNPLQVPRVAG